MPRSWFFSWCLFFNTKTIMKNMKASSKKHTLVKSLRVKANNSTRRRRQVRRRIATSRTSTVSLSSSLPKQTLMISETSKSQYSFCDICMDTKAESEMFQNANVCGHLFCINCIRGHVAAKIKENITMVKCPEPRCEGMIGPEVCRSIVPKEVFERWENILCESLIMEAQKFYCPFKDCSAMLVDDGAVAVTSSECPNCHRLFCAQCKVAWHSGMSCIEFQRARKGERSPDDILLDNLAKNKKWTKCSKCKLFVEKNGGCQHITCKCGHNFCYGCGKPYNGGSHVCAAV